MATRQTTIPRTGPKPDATATIRKGRAPLGASPKAPVAEAAKPALQAPATRRTAPDSTKSSATRPRPQGTSRVAVDVPAEIAERFRDRARRSRYTQAEALTGALTLLEQLDAAAYDELLSGTRQ